MKKVDYLITGSNGLLGQTIVNKLLDFGASFLAVSKGENRNPDLLSNYEELDLTRVSDVQDLFLRYHPKFIINTAAVTNVDLCEDEQELCDTLNISAVETLLHESAKINAKFVHLSTDFIFDGENGPYKEEDEPNPLSYYGRSKWKSEELIINQKYKNWSIVRTIIVYGYVPNMSRSNIVLWAMESLPKGEPMNIVDDQFRSPTYADDLADACLEICKRDATGIFHVSGPKVYSIYDFVCEIAKTLGVKYDQVQSISSSVLNQKAKRPPKTGFTNAKAIKELNYKPRNLSETIPLIQEKLKS